MTSIQSMKSAITTRVDPLNALRLFDDSRQLGNPATCPLNAMDPDMDEFSRPQGGARYRLINLNDPACSQFVYTTSKKLKHENAERPVLGPCNPGDRGAGDFLYGSVRDRYPENLYGEGDRGAFISPFLGLKPDEGIPEYTKTYEPQTAQPLTLSHDGLIKRYY